MSVLRVSHQKAPHSSQEPGPPLERQRRKEAQRTQEQLSRKRANSMQFRQRDGPCHLRICFNLHWGLQLRSRAGAR